MQDAIDATVGSTGDMIGARADEAECPLLELETIIKRELACTCEVGRLTNDVAGASHDLAEV